MHWYWGWRKWCLSINQLLLSSGPFYFPMLCSLRRWSVFGLGYDIPYSDIYDTVHCFHCLWCAASCPAQMNCCTSELVWCCPEHPAASVHGYIFKEAQCVWSYAMKNLVPSGQNRSEFCVSSRLENNRFIYLHLFSWETWFVCCLLEVLFLQWCDILQHSSLWSEVLVSPWVQVMIMQMFYLN